MMLATSEQQPGLLSTRSTRAIWTVWHVLAAFAAPLAAARLRLGADIWSLNANEQLSLLFLALVYLLVAAVLTRIALRRGVRLRDVVFAVCLSYAALFIALFYFGLGVSRLVFITAGLFSVVLASLSLEMMPTSLQSSVAIASDRRRGTRDLHIPS